MEEILIELMSVRCISMHNRDMRCFSKGKCDGQCAQFQKALMDLEDYEVQNHKVIVDVMDNCKN